MTYRRSHPEPTAKGPLTVKEQQRADMETRRNQKMEEHWGKQKETDNE